MGPKLTFNSNIKLNLQKYVHNITILLMRPKGKKLIKNDKSDVKTGSFIKL